MDESVEEASTEPWEAEEWMKDVGRLHLDEAHAMRDALDATINDTRSRSLSLLGMIGTALTIAGALGSDLYHSGWLAFAAICFAAGLFCALWCQKPRDGYVPGPDVPAYLQAEYTMQQSEALAIRDLANEIYNIRAENEKSVLKPILRFFQLQTFFLGLAVLALLTSAALNIDSSKESNDQEHPASAAPTTPPGTD